MCAFKGNSNNTWCLVAHSIAVATDIEYCGPNETWARLPVLGDYNRENTKRCLASSEPSQREIEKTWSKAYGQRIPYFETFVKSGIVKK